MAVDALRGADGGMRFQLRHRGGEVTLLTQLLAGAFQQETFDRLMRFVAEVAIAGLDRGVDKFRVLEEFLMAFEAECTSRSAKLLRLRAQMTRRALVLAVRLMDEFLRRRR